MIRILAALALLWAALPHGAHAQARAGTYPVTSNPSSPTAGTFDYGTLSTDGGIRVKPVVAGSDVSAANPLPTTASARADVTGTGSIDPTAPNAAVTVATAGISTVGWRFSGIAGGAVLTMEESNDGGTTWSTVNCVTPGTGALSTTVSANSQCRTGAAARSQVRARLSTTGTGGPILVAYTASQADALVMLGAPLPAGGNTIGAVIAKATSAAFTVAGCTVGASSGQCLASATAVNHVTIQNTSASANVACAWGGTAILNNSGSIMLVPGQSATWGLNTGGVPPSGALNCIASAASTPLYVEYN